MLKVAFGQVFIRDVRFIAIDIFPHSDRYMFDRLPSSLCKLKKLTEPLSETPRKISVQIIFWRATLSSLAAVVRKIRMKFQAIVKPFISTICIYLLNNRHPLFVMQVSKFIEGRKCVLLFGAESFVF